MITLVQISEDETLDLRVIGESHVFQKPIMRLRFDKTRDRIVAGGMDSHLKFLSVEESLGGVGDQLKIVYKIKVPNEIYALDLSPDSNHFAVGLNDGSLIVKSKQQEII